MEQTTPEKPSATAKKLRKALKTAFPDTKFKVHVTHKVNLTVSWSDGPLENEVKEVTDKYNSNGYKGYEYEGSRYCGAKQIFLVRNETMTTQASPPWTQNTKREVEVKTDPVPVNIVLSDEVVSTHAESIEPETGPEDKETFEAWQAMTTPKQEPEPETVKSQGLYTVDIPVTKPKTEGAVESLPFSVKQDTKYELSEDTGTIATDEAIKAPAPQRDLKHEINRYKTALEVVREIKTTDPDLIESIISQASLLAAEYFGIV